MKVYGLNDAQVQESKSKFGDNSISEQKGESFFEKLIGNFKDPMIIILCVALLINVVFVIIGESHWYEAVGIGVAVLLATFVSTFSEYRNENAFQKLQEEASRIFCKVYRNGEIVQIPINDIVVDDCILLQSGDKIPADGVIIDGILKVDQSVLNGESKEASKEAIPKDYFDTDKTIDFLNPHKVFRGSVVCSNNAVMRVTTVGDKSVYGEIAKELQVEEERDTPLKVKLKKLAHGISKFGYIGGIAIAVAFMIQNMLYNGDTISFAHVSTYFSDWGTVLNDFVQAIMLAVIIIVMAVPEGLPLMIALVSALNMGKMLRDNVLVRKIAGIETAGSLNILFSDKTGTITKGQLEAVTFIDGQVNEYHNYNDVVDELGKVLSFSIHFNTDAIISGEEGNLKVIGGNATERAILNYVANSRHNEDVQVATVSNIPFNSHNKYSATTITGDRDITLIKGAPEKILEKCKTFYDQQGNKAIFADKAKLEAKINELAGRAIRVLAIATAEQVIEGESLPEGEWTLVGIIGIRDEVRQESITAIAEVQHAGVQVVMITGDRQDTAVAIAKEAGIVQKETDLVLTSNDLAQMSDDDIKAKLQDIRVVARALPSDKSRLVRLAQEMNLVVGMTGDGVNDSPALKKADVGFAMGGGTEVAKEASDIVILDDNFSSIDKAIRYGRTIFNNIRKFIVFQLTINVSAVMISFVAPLIGMKSPLTIIQILWINLIMDTLAALAFGGEPALQRYMSEKPKKREESIVSPSMWSSILTGSLWTFALSMVFLKLPIISDIFREGDATNPTKYLLTGFFTFYVLVAAFNAFNARTTEMNVFEHIRENHGFWKVIGLIIITQVILTYVGGSVLNCYGLVFKEWVVVILMAFTIIPVDLIRKALFRKKTEM